MRIDDELRLLRAAADNASLKSECEILREEVLRQRVKFHNDYVELRQWYRDELAKFSAPRFLLDALSAALQPDAGVSARAEALRMLSEWRARQGSA